MTDGALVWPATTRELTTPTLDLTQWNGFAFRDDDLVVNTHGKSRMAWAQAILVLRSIALRRRPLPITSAEGLTRGLIRKGGRRQQRRRLTDA